MNRGSSSARRSVLRIEAGSYGSRGDHGRAAGDRLRHREPEPLVEGGEDGELRALEEKHQCLVPHISGEQNVVCDAKSAEQTVHPLPLCSCELTDDDQLVVAAEFSREAGVSVDESIDVLPGVHTALVDDKALSNGWKLTLQAPECSVPITRGLEVLRRPFACHDDAVRRDIGMLDQVIRGGLGHRDHAIGTPHQLESGPKPAPLTRISEVEIREDERDQIVDGHDERDGSNRSRPDAIDRSGLERRGNVEDIAVGRREPVGKRQPATSREWLSLSGNRQVRVQHV
jgi:hypothetical protein